MLFSRLRHAISQQSAMAWSQHVFLLSELVPTWWVPGHWRDMGHRVSCGVICSRLGKQTQYPSAVPPGMGSQRPGPFWHSTFLSSGWETVLAKEKCYWKSSHCRNLRLKTSTLVEWAVQVPSRCSHGLLLLLIIPFSKRNWREIKYPLSAVYYHWEQHNGKFLVRSVQGRDSFGTSHPFLNNMLMLKHKLINISLIGSKLGLSWTLLKTPSSRVLLGETFSFCESWKNVLFLFSFTDSNTQVFLNYKQTALTSTIIP